MAQTQLHKYVVDDGEGFFKVISLDKVLYLLKTNIAGMKPEKRLGQLNRNKRYYVTYRRRYMKSLANQRFGLPNWMRVSKSMELGIPRQKDGHYFDKFKGYGISKKILDDFHPGDLVVFVEEQVDTGEMRLLAIEREDVYKCKMWNDYSSGRTDPQYIIPEVNLHVVAEKKLDNLMITQKL